METNLWSMPCSSGCDGLVCMKPGGNWLDWVCGHDRKRKTLLNCRVGSILGLAAGLRRRKMGSNAIMRCMAASWSFALDFFRLAPNTNISLVTITVMAYCETAVYHSCQLVNMTYCQKLTPTQEHHQKRRKPGFPPNSSTSLLLEETIKFTMLTFRCLILFRTIPPEADKRLNHLGEAMSPRRLFH